jgi:hypothetical protein
MVILLVGVAWCSQLVGAQDPSVGIPRTHNYQAMP